MKRATVSALAAAAIFAAGASAQAQTLKSGYAVSDELCGGFPKVRIGMQSGACAGLVASNADGLIFPRLGRLGLRGGDPFDGRGGFHGLGHRNHPETGFLTGNIVEPSGSIFPVTT